MTAVPLRTSGESDEEQRRLEAIHRYQILDTPPDNTFDRICALAARACQAPIATITIVDEDRIWFKARHGLDAEQISRADGLCAEVIRTGEPCVVTDTAVDPRTRDNPLVRGELAVRFYAAVPITTQDGQRPGTLDVMDTRPRELTADELATLQDLAALVADQLELRLAAITLVRIEEQARERMRDETRRVGHIAETLQRSLMPTRLPPVPGLEVATFYQPVSRDDVGGDFYDVFPIDDQNRWGVFVGDVCGKGVRAAEFTSLARYSLRAAAALEPGPAEVLADLNAAILIDPASDDLSYCTVGYAELAPAGEDRWRITVAVGGHPPPLLIRANGTVERLETEGTLVGCFPDVLYGEITVTAGPGDTLLLYSDGLTDAKVRGAWLGVDGVVELIDPGATGAAELVAQIERLVAGAAAPLRDDIAVVAVTVDSEGGRR